MSEEKSLYTRLGGYDAITAVVENLLPRLMSDPKLARFWAVRADDSVRREKQLLIDFLCNSAGGPVFYTGRDMGTSHQGLGITTDDWNALMGHLNATLNEFNVPDAERAAVVGFAESLKADVLQRTKAAGA